MRRAESSSPTREPLHGRSGAGAASVKSGDGSAVRGLSKEHILRVHLEAAEKRRGVEERRRRLEQRAEVRDPVRAAQAAYVRGDIEVDELERLVERVLRQEDES
jgi:hypothetical protein